MNRLTDEQLHEIAERRRMDTQMMREWAKGIEHMRSTHNYITRSANELDRLYAAVPALFAHIKALEEEKDVYRNACLWVSANTTDYASQLKVRGALAVATLKGADNQ